MSQHPIPANIALPCKLFHLAGMIDILDTTTIAGVAAGESDQLRSTNFPFLFPNGGSINLLILPMGCRNYDYINRKTD